MSEELARWAADEQVYVDRKFGRDQDRQMYDDWLKDRNLSEWFRQITQYFGRAELYLAGMQEYKYSDEEKRRLERMAQQALGKAMMTLRDCVESSIRVWGPMPVGGKPSGDGCD